MPKAAHTSDFWRRLMEAREEAGLPLDQETIGREAGVWQSAVTKWKTGKGLPTLSKAADMAVKAKVSVDWLLTGRPPRSSMAKSDPQLGVLMGIWDRLHPETAAEIVAYALYRKSIQPVQRRLSVVPDDKKQSASGRTHRR